MRPERIELFEREHPGHALPAFTTLSDADAKKVRESLARAIGLDANVDPLALTKALRARSEPVPGLNAENGPFSLEAAFRAADIQPMPQLRLTWYRYDEIDEMAVSDVAAYFDDLWYPRADDLDIFDRSLGWILSINYYGEVLAQRLR